MTDPTIAHSVLFADLFDKPVVATFDREQASSDGGAILLKAADRVYGLVKTFARCLVDGRAPEKIRHTLEDLVGQRVFGIACGHPDGNDADRLADDPIHKLLLGRDPVARARLASQPTVSRFENNAGRVALYRLGRELAGLVIERHRRRLHGRARRITIDLDPTADPTDGAQQLTFFNGHYDSWCYLPLLAFVTFDRESEQYLCAAVLRPGNAQASDGTLSVLWCARQTGEGWPVKVRRKEGVTNHLHPESCAGRCEAAGEALTGARTGRAIEHRKRGGLERRDYHSGRRPHRHHRAG